MRVRVDMNVMEPPKIDKKVKKPGGEWEMCKFRYEKLPRLYYILAKFSKEEFKVALFDMNPDKPPGPDGFIPGYYQRMWDMVEDDVVHAWKSWLQDG